MHLDKNIIRWIIFASFVILILLMSYYSYRLGQITEYQKHLNLFINALNVIPQNAPLDDIRRIYKMFGREKDWNEIIRHCEKKYEEYRKKIDELTKHCEKEYE